MLAITLYRFLKLHKRKFIHGITICKQLGLPLAKLKTLDDVTGISSMGIYNKNHYKTKSQWMRYAKNNVFFADIRYFFTYKGMAFCLKDRPLRNSIRIKPRNKLLKLENKVKKVW